MHVKCVQCTCANIITTTRRFTHGWAGTMFFFSPLFCIFANDKKWFGWQKREVFSLSEGIFGKSVVRCARLKRQQKREKVLRVRLAWVMLFVVAILKSRTAIGLSKNVQIWRSTDLWMFSLGIPATMNEPFCRGTIVTMKPLNLIVSIIKRIDTFSYPLLIWFCKRTHQIRNQLNNFNNATNQNSTERDVLRQTFLKFKMKN